MMKKNPHIGSSVDDFFEEEEILEETNLIATKRVIAWQISEAMNKQNLNKTTMAQKMGTSRSSLDRLLDPNNTSVTLETIERAAKAVGKRIHLELIDIT